VKLSLGFSVIISAFIKYNHLMKRPNTESGIIYKKMKEKLETAWIENSILDWAKWRAVPFQ